MALDIDTRKTSGQSQPARSSFERLMDVYWGGTERRITGLTLRIIGINALCVVVLMFAALNFGRYEANIIQDHLTRFETQAYLIAQTLSMDNLSGQVQPQTMEHIKALTDSDIILIDPDGAIVGQTDTVEGIIDRLGYTPRSTGSQRLTLAQMIGWFMQALPNRKTLPDFPMKDHETIDLKAALHNSDGGTLRAWLFGRDAIVLSAAIPLDNRANDDLTPITAHFLESGHNITLDVHKFWQQVFTLFLVILAITTAISIYVSGTIARPLKRLTRCAEAIRRSKDSSVEIPDLSGRHDEIGELSLVMRDMTEALKARLDAIQTFAADVSHELKNPLTSMKSAIETLEYAKDKKAQQTLFSILHHDIERMDRLISDVSRASRLDAALSRESFESLALDRVLDRLIERYKAHYGDQYCFNLSVKDNNDSPILIRANEGRLMQVFENLLDNAISFTDAKMNKAISITVRPHRGNVVIHVDDEGTGIPAAKLEAIFDRFYSERRKTDNFGQHSGLGLAIVRQIIEAMGGSIRAVNRSTRKGARFIIRLPLS